MDFEPLRFPPPTNPWSTNRDRNFHPKERHKHVDVWKQAAGWAWLASRQRITWKPRRTIVQIHVPFTTTRKRDPHNYCGTVMKAIIDGLVECGVWPDDDPEWVGHREPILYKGSEVLVYFMFEDED